VADYTTAALLRATEVSDCSQVNIYTTLITGSYTITSNLDKKQFFTQQINLYASVNEVTLFIVCQHNLKKKTLSKNFKVNEIKIKQICN